MSGFSFLKQVVRFFSRSSKLENSTNNESCPKTATSSLVSFCGALAYILISYIIFAYRPFGYNVIASMLLILLVTILSIATVDIFKEKVHLRVSTGLDFNLKDGSWHRTGRKYLGLVGSLLFIGFFYWLFPEYSDSFYKNYFKILSVVIPLLLIVALPYIYIIDRHMTNPFDGYYEMGKAAMFDWSNINPSLLAQHLLGWLVKGFFLPLMFVFMYEKVQMLFGFRLAEISGFDWFYDISIGFLYFMDVGLATMAYVFTLRIIDTHLRSSESTMLGWVVALVCYPPVWTILFSNKYYMHASDNNWRVWLQDTPIIFALWGSIIIILTGIYVWSTIIFGARFSNLTHRGIITNGPYRFTKHPAYIAKNLSWWLMTVPFLGIELHTNALKYSLLLLGLNVIYSLRARTEERHLSNDPDYVAYALWIDKHGIFRFINHMPILKYYRYKPLTK